MALAAVFAFVLATGVASLKTGRTISTNITSLGGAAEPAQAPHTFAKYYTDHKSGRGIWKWSNALDAYQRHFGKLAGKSLSVAEVGVQSGGSLLLWQNVLGKQIQLYGFDINPNCKKFEEKNVTITIGDQGDWKMWHGFFAKVPTGLNILVDDGGHEANQMLTTMQSAFPYIHSGGYISIEDITGKHYFWSFFQPTATFLAKMADGDLLDAVHIYPMLMVIRKGHFAKDSPQAEEGALEFSKTTTLVTNFTAMWTAISTVAPGSAIVVQNQTWGSFFTADALHNFFSNFIDLQAVAFKDTPSGCSTTTATVCTNEVTPLNHLQSRVSGVHVYKDRAVIEVPATPPRIAAVRRGTEWINYAL